MINLPKKMLSVAIIGDNAAPIRSLKNLGTLRWGIDYIISNLVFSDHELSQIDKNFLQSMQIPHQQLQQKINRDLAHILFNGIGKLFNEQYIDPEYERHYSRLSNCLLPYKPDVIIFVDCLIPIAESFFNVFQDVPIINITTSENTSARPSNNLLSQAFLMHTTEPVLYAEFAGCGTLTHDSIEQQLLRAAALNYGPLINKALQKIIEG